MANRWAATQHQRVVLRRVDPDELAPVWTWQRVVHLDLSGNKLAAVPDLNLPLLEQLDLAHNELRQLTARLQLPNLSRLDLSNNFLHAFPRIDADDMPKIKYLDLCDNDLHDITTDMLRLCAAGCSLASLELRGNKRLGLPPSPIIERGGDSVCQFFASLNLDRRTCWSQTVLVVGKEASGKTALCQALLGQRCPDMTQTRDMSTIGIDTKYWPTLVALSGRNRLLCKFTVGMVFVWRVRKLDGINVTS